MLRLGFDIGGTTINAVLCEDDGAPLARCEREFSHELNNKDLTGRLYEMAEELCATAGHALSAVSRLGAAVPGNLSADGETVINAHNLGFFYLPLAGLLREQFPGLEVRLTNDANAAALAEHRGGALNGYDCAVLLTLGTGVGCGLIINGRLFNGGRNSGCEAGHLVMGYGGDSVCTCGQVGCLETFCSATALEDLAGAAGWPDEWPTAKQIAEAVQAGDYLAMHVWRVYLDALATALASLVNVLDPQIIALGGGLSEAGDILFAHLQPQVEEKCFFSDCCPVVPAQLGRWAGAIGAALL